MKSVALRSAVCVLRSVLLRLRIEGGARRTQAATTDPRVGLKPGLRDAGQAARNMELVASLPKPQGFFDPSEPAGEPTAPETHDADNSAIPSQPRRASRRRSRAAGAAARTAASGLNFANSDLAFSGKSRVHRQLQRVQHLRHRDAEEAAAARVGRLSRAARATSRSTATCCSCRSSRRAAGSTAARRASGDRSAPSAFAASASSTSATCKHPKQVAAVQTCRGSHTHTLVIDPKDKANLYVYGSGTGTVRAGRGARRLLRAGSRRRSEHRALQHRRHPGAARRAADRRTSSTGRASSPTRRPARSPGSGRAAITDRARRRPRRPISATTSRSSRRSAWPPARARATASCSTSPIRCIPCGSIR